jgi:hypothetical protein
MAYLVCYSRSAPSDHSREKAIYLDQEFYETIFQYCLVDRSKYPVLSVLASLRYKSPLLVVSGEEIDALTSELTKIHESGHAHPQLTEFRHVCTKAKADGCNLSISGDMYREL